MCEEIRLLTIFLSMQPVYTEPWKFCYRLQYCLHEPDLSKALTRLQAPVDQKVDSTIHWINLYPVENAVGFPNTYPLESTI